MALVGAVNPDFGQVEVDPAVVNLTAFETFFEEKRPFFTEGGQVFLRFGRSGASEYTTYFYPEPQLFYSRRIGRAPQGRAAGDFVDTPTGHHDPGRGQARRPHEERLERRGARGGDRAGVRARGDGHVPRPVEVEPLTNYFVGRAQHGLGRRASIGFLGTAVVRDLETPDLDGLLVDRAFVGASTATSSWTASATGSSPAGSRGARSRAARRRCCASSARRRATTSGPTPRT